MDALSSAVTWLIKADVNFKPNWILMASDSRFASRLKSIAAVKRMRKR